MFQPRPGNAGILGIKGWFQLVGFKTLRCITFLSLGTCLTLPCLVAFVIPSGYGMEESKATEHVMSLWKYKPLNQDGAL